MLRSVALKFVAFVLSAVLLVCAAGSLLGIGVLGYHGLYDRDFEMHTGETLEHQGENIAWECLRIYASYTLGSCPEQMLLGLYGDVYASAQGNWNAVIRQGDETLYTLNGRPDLVRTFEYTLSVTYLSTVPPEEGAEPVHYSVPQPEGEVDYLLYECISPEYTVTLEISPEYAMGEDYSLLEQLYSARYRLITVAAVSLLFFAACLVYLCCVAGRSPGSAAVRPGGLNRLPLDLYNGILVLIGYVILRFGVEFIEEAADGDFDKTALLLGAMVGLVTSLLVMALFSHWQRRSRPRVDTGGETALWAAACG